ncbi:MAG: serine protease [Planctomycetaceae bacterium]|nr:serine protease [Planctomycetaceae bacterium]
MTTFRFSLTILLTCITSSLYAQAVCLPAPRLMATMPMGGKVGSTFDVAISGQNCEDVESLHFSHPGITATPKIANGEPVPEQFVVTIAKDVPLGIYEARLMTRLGVSSSRAFSVGNLPEVKWNLANRSVKDAMPLALDTVCNAYMSSRAIDYYMIEAKKGQRLVIDCAAQGIDSKLKPVVILGDEKGADLIAERRGGLIDYTVPKEGKYTIKVHDLTYLGGPHHFYRLVARTAKPGKAVAVARMPSTRKVSACSWPPVGLDESNAVTETEPNNKHTESQAITLPCNLRGSFFPAADVDTFEFSAKKDEVWWVEVASERLGRPTDPNVVIQRVGSDGKMIDVAELNDIKSPVTVSSNGYSYNGPVYNVGTSDVIGSFKAPEDGTYRLQVRDLFGGTRRDPQNVYHLVIRQAAPDFALAAWALHMNLRNGDRNALSKPIALRRGATMAIEVVRVNRDGFNGEIELSMEGLPEGVSAKGIKIGAGQGRGYLLITAEKDAPRGLAGATIFGRATIDGKEVTHRCKWASMRWPVKDQWQEIPTPRLMADVPVSVCETEHAPLVIVAQEDKVIEATEGEKLTIPLVHTRFNDFSGPSISLRNWNSGLGSVATIEASLTADSSEAVLDLAAMKTKPGEYVIAFYGSAVAKYRYNEAAVGIAELYLKQSKDAATAAATKAKQLAKTAKTATPEQKPEADKAAQAAAEQQKAAEAAATAAQNRLKSVTAKAQPRDIVDIVVSKPITIRVKAR